LICLCLSIPFMGFIVLKNKL